MKGLKRVLCLTLEGDDVVQGRDGARKLASPALSDQTHAHRCSTSFLTHTFNNRDTTTSEKCAIWGDRRKNIWKKEGVHTLWPRRVTRQQSARMHCRGAWARFVRWRGTRTNKPPLAAEAEKKKNFLKFLNIVVEFDEWIQMKKQKQNLEEY